MVALIKTEFIMSTTDPIREERTESEYEPVRKFNHVQEVIHRAPVIDLDKLYEGMERGEVTVVELETQINPFASTFNSVGDLTPNYFLNLPRGMGVFLKGQYGVYQNILGDQTTRDLYTEIDSARDNILNHIPNFRELDISGQRMGLQKWYRFITEEDQNPLLRYREAIESLFEEIERRIDPEQVIQFSEGMIQKLIAIKSELINGDREPRRCTLEDELEMYDRLHQGYYAAILRAQNRLELDEDKENLS